MEENTEYLQWFNMYMLQQMFVMNIPEAPLFLLLYSHCMCLYLDSG